MQASAAQQLELQSVIGGQYSLSYAGFWKRLGASIIDQIILSILSYFILLPLFAVVGVNMFSPSIDETDVGAGFLMLFLEMYLVTMLLLFLGQWLYYALMESTVGATLGKLALRIEVTDRTGSRPSFARASGRYFAKILSSLTFGIGYLMAGFTEQKQALHDMVSGCLVVDH